MRTGRCMVLKPRSSTAALQARSVAPAIIKRRRCTKRVTRKTVLPRQPTCSSGIGLRPQRPGPAGGDSPARPSEHAAFGQLAGTAADFDATIYPKQQAAGEGGAAAGWWCQRLECASTPVVQVPAASSAPATLQLRLQPTCSLAAALEALAPEMCSDVAAAPPASLSPSLCAAVLLTSWTSPAVLLQPVVRLPDDY